MNSEGNTKYRALLDGGFSTTQADEWKGQATAALRAGGYDENAIAQYWGEGKPDLAPEVREFQTKHDLNVPPEKRVASTALEFFEAGLDQSVTGLAMGKPDVVMPENAGMFGAILGMAGQVVGDAPAIIFGTAGGAVAGASGGAAVGSVVPGAGTAAGAAIGAPAGALYGGGFLPGYLRRALMDRYEKGEVTTFRDFWSLLTGAALAGHKEGAINAITAGIGGQTGEKVLRATGNAAIATSTNLITQATTGTAMGAAIEGKVPSVEDLAAASALVVGLHAGYKVVGSAPNARIALTDAGRMVERNLRDIYARTGMHPDDMRANADTGPVPRSDVFGRTANDDVTVNGVAVREATRKILAEEDAKYDAMIKADDMSAVDMLEYAAYLRRRQEQVDAVSNRDLTDEQIAEIQKRGYEHPDGDDMPPDVEGMASSDRDRRTEFLDRIAGTAFRQTEGGGLVPDTTTIASYLKAFGKRAGFNFIVGHPETVSAEKNPNIIETPHYHHTRKSVFIPDTAEELNRRWYGLGRYEIIYHEVGHAIDYSLGRLHTRAFNDSATPGVVDPLRLEMQEASKVYRPQLWDMAPKHMLKPAELFADAIATYISNPTMRGKMPLFAAKYAKLLEPYIAIAERNLPKRGEKGWVPPGGEEAASGGRGGATPPGGGRTPPPPPPGGPDIIPPDGPNIRPKITDERIHPTLSTRIGRFLEGRIGERPERGWRNLFNPRLLYRQFVSELGAGRTFDVEHQIGPDDLGIEDMLRQTYASAPRARYFMRWGGLDAITLEPNGAPSYLSAYDVVRENGGNLQDFEGYRVAARVVELSERGIETGFDLMEANAILTEGRPIYGEANRVVNEAKNNVIDYARDSGFFSEAGAAEMKAANSSHIMFRRIMDPNYNPTYMGKTRGFNTKMPVRRIEGSERMILPPTVADIENLHFIVAMADRNRAVGSVIGRVEQVNADLAAAGLGLNTTMRRIEDANRPRFEVLDEDGNVVYDSRHPPRPADDSPFEGIAVQRSIDPHRNPGQFIYYRNGRAEVWETNDHELARILRAPGDAPEMNAAMWIMGEFAKFARLGVITSPDFPARSIARGEISRTVNMPYGGAPFSSFFQALRDVVFETPAYRDAVAKGATGGSFLGMDVAPLVEDINTTFDQTHTYSNAWNFFRHPVEAMRALQDRLYTAQAVGYYQSVERAGVYESSIKSGSEARKSSIDVSEKAGLAVVNSWHRSTLFLRTSTLDIAQLGRAFRERPVSTMIKIAKWIMIPTALTWIANTVYDSMYENDADFRAKNPGYVPYRELPRWQRENSFVLPPIGGVRLRLPLKPYTSGFFGAVLERGLDATFLKDPRAFKDWHESFAALVIPGFIPALVLPIYEGVANTRAVSNSPLVPASLEAASGYMRYTPDTTETAKAISRWLSPDVGLLARFDVGLPDAMSPIMIDNLARGWAGPVPVEILKALEAPFKPRAHPWTIADVPVVKSFIARHPGAGAQSVQDFYDAMKKVESKGRDWFLAVRRQNAGEMRELMLDNRSFLRLASIKEAISSQSAVIDAINKNKKLTNDEKLKQIDAIYGSMILMAKTGTKIIDGASNGN